MSIYDIYTKSLLHMDDLDNDTTFKDESGKTWTGHTTDTQVPYQQDGIVKFIGGSGAFDGTSWLDTPFHSDFNFGEGEFTIDFWVYLNSIQTTYLLGQSDSSGDNASFSIISDSGDLTAYLSYNSGVNIAEIYGPSTISIEEWHHIALVRSVNTIYLYIDGVKGDPFDASGISFDSSSYNLSIGRRGEVDDFYLDGYLDEVRISKGIARWVDNFISPTTPYTPTKLDDVYTKSLLHMDASSGENVFTDESGRLWTGYTNDVDVPYQTGAGDGKFIGAGAFNGTSWLETPHSPDFDFGNENFTIDFWVYLNTSQYCLLTGQGNDDHTSYSVTIESDTENVTAYLRYNSGANTAEVHGGSTLTTEAWNHIALVRNGNDVYVYTNGVKGTVFDATGITFDSSIYNFSIGRAGELDDYYLNGNIDEFRITKGIARWASNFVPPAEAYGNVHNIEDNYTKILMHMNYEQANELAFIDETGKLWSTEASFVGTTDAEFVFGEASLYVGNHLTDFMSTPRHPDFNLGNSDWTFDLRVKFHTLESALATFFWQLDLNSGSLFIVAYSGITNKIICTQIENSVAIWDFEVPFSPSVDVWYHIAVERYGNTPLVFIDGESQTVTENTTISGKTANEIIVNANIGQIILGTEPLIDFWMDEFRFSNGVARWTDNFDLPIQEYASDSVTNVISLLHMNGLNEASDFIDETGKEWDAVGNAHIDTSSFKFGQASAYFDTGTYVQSLITDWQLDSGINSNSWTVDFWIKWDIDPTSQEIGIFGQLDAGTDSFWQLRYQEDRFVFDSRINNIPYYINYPVDSHSFTVGTWYHIALVKDGNNGLLFFIDGIKKTSLLEGTPFSLPSVFGPMLIGRGDYSGSANFKGWIDEFRITQGVPQWTTNFTPPTTEYTLELYSFSPSESPSSSESPSTSASPSTSHSLSPSKSPSLSSSASPSKSPSISPSQSPSAGSSFSPSISPSFSPSISPSVSPSVSKSPSISPSVSPSISISPSKSPSMSASRSPSLSASKSPSKSPSTSPSGSASPSVPPADWWNPSSYATAIGTFVSGTLPDVYSNSDSTELVYNEFINPIDSHNAGVYFNFSFGEGIPIPEGVSLRLIIVARASYDGIQIGVGQHDLYFEHQNPNSSSTTSVNGPNYLTTSPTTFKYNLHTDPHFYYENKAKLTFYTTHIFSNPLDPSATIYIDKYYFEEMSASPSKSPSISRSKSPSISSSRSPSISHSKSTSLSPSESVSPSTEPQVENDFDIFGQAETPAIFLCNPNRDRIAAIGRIIYDTKLKLRFNALSEFSFKMPQSVDNQTLMEAYDKVEVKRQIYIEGVGYFIIVSAVENNEGFVPFIEVNAQSLESEFISKKLNLLSGTGRLYDIYDSNNITPTGQESSIIGYILSLINNGVIGDSEGWKLGGYLNPELMTKYRTFNISDSNVYSFLMNDAEKAFECIFVFDTISRTIFIKTLEEAVTTTDIFISYDNLAKKTELSEISDEIATGLYVYGGNGLDIRSVNPTGTNIIYDFTYYKNTDWMTQELVDAVTNWEIKVLYNLDNYNAQLANYLTLYNQLAVLEADKASLDAEYAALEVALKAAIEADTNVSQANADLNAKKAEVDAKQAEIDAKNSEIDSLTVIISAINDDLNIENPVNFSISERIELSRFMLQNTYQNENIITTDSFTPAQIQETKSELYSQALGVLGRVSRPRYEFKVDAVNFVQLEEFKVFTNQIPITLGAKVTVATSNFPVETVLLELVQSYDNPDDFSMTFSNRLRLDDGAYQYSDLLGQTVSTGSSVSFNGNNWSDWTNNYKNSVTEFITSALDASKNEVINASGQEIIINQAGLRGRKMISEGVYSPEEVWLTGNTIAFTKDSWDTASTAIGKINFPGGGSGYGIVGQYIIGNIIAGNELTIEAADGSFIVNETGTTLYNSKFTISSPEGSGMIIDANDNINVIEMGQITEGIITSPTFSVSKSGNVYMRGNLDSGPNYLHTDGTARIGALTITINPSRATFAGDIYANHLVGLVDWSQITNAPLPTDRWGTGYNAGGLTTGYMSPSRLSEGVWTADWIQINATSGNHIQISSAGISLVGSSGGIVAIGDVDILGGLSINNQTGESTTVTYGPNSLTFTNGILTSHT